MRNPWSKQTQLEVRALMASRDIPSLTTVERTRIADQTNKSLRAVANLEYTTARQIQKQRGNANAQYNTAT